MSAGLPKKPMVSCPECGKRNQPAASRCWFCLGPLPAGSEVTFLEANVPETLPLSSTFRFSLVLVVIALIAAFLGVVREAPGLGILLALLVAPALMVLSADREARRARDRPLGRAEEASSCLEAVLWTSAFLGTTAVLVCILVAAMVASLFNCSGTFPF